MSRGVLVWRPFSCPLPPPVRVIEERSESRSTRRQGWKHTLVPSPSGVGREGPYFGVPEDS